MLEQALSEAADFAERTLDALLPKPSGPETALFETMRSTVLNRPERFHAFLVLQSGRLFGVDRGALGRAAAAVECIHACYPRNPDAVSADAREALVPFAHGLLAESRAHGDPFVRCELVLRLSQAVGPGGLAGGRAVERALSDATPTMHEITRLERMTAAALITFSSEAGAILGKGSPAARMALSNYGQELGLAAQIADDLKAVNAVNRPSVVGMLGPERAGQQARALARQAAHHLDLFDEKADLLRAAAEFVVARM